MPPPHPPEFRPKAIESHQGTGQADRTVRSGESGRPCSCDQPASRACTGADVVDAPGATRKPRLSEDPRFRLVLPGPTHGVLSHPM